MPGWYIHLDVARQALATLPANGGAQTLFATGGPSAAAVSNIALAQPAYVALGAIGPDIFFLLPDFKPPMGSMLWGAMSVVYDFYNVWDDVYLGPFEDQMGPILDNASDEVNALTGGMLASLSAISTQAFSVLFDFALVIGSRNYDAFSLLGSGVQNAYDEQTFFWSDMLHYRKTYEFAAHLWQAAGTDQRKQAFALGWMSHLATDVTGHCFVNEKCGGPYRLHWQRHHLVENHMDAKVYDSEFGGRSVYQMLSCAALHLWVAFNPDNTSRTTFFATQPGPTYATGDDTPSALDRKSKWDVDSVMPDFLASFLADALRAVYPPRSHPLAPTDKGQCADHPTIISAITSGSDGYPTAAQITATYFWLFKYIKFTTTDYFKLLRPTAPPVIPFAPFPSPPGTGESDPGPGATSDIGHDIMEVLLAILAWIAYLGEVAAWGAVNLAALATGPLTYPAREALYEYVELPLYNAWMALHWYMAMTGFVYPMPAEISAGLMTLGVGTGDVWGAVQAALDDFGGGLNIPPTTSTEPSGMEPGKTKPYPFDVVVDPPSPLGSVLGEGGRCGSCDPPSEYMRPWRWPQNDDQGDLVPIELPLSCAGPYASMQDATVLMNHSPGDSFARAAFAECANEVATVHTANTMLPLGKHLGDPVDYTAFVVASLTRTAPGAIVNYNLDADRGYGYKCWDWVRTASTVSSPTLTPTLAGGVPAIPSAFSGYATAGMTQAQAEAANRTYDAPLRPGAGWCRNDLAWAPATVVTIPIAHRPLMRDPAIVEANPGANFPVLIRYIDLERRLG
ncbi:MAG TPA: zinc dependent phospholipase C family protein [Polyangiaceae bacterium]|jgi:hypothetical protein